jgi:hypothetical protein
LGAGLRLAVTLLVISSAASGCVGRVAPPPAALAVRADVWPGVVRYRVARDTAPLAEARRQALRNKLAWRASMDQTGPLPPASFLAISGATQRDHVDFNLAYIPASFTEPHPEPFAPRYMRALYQMGYDLAAKGYPWSKFPPGYDSPVLTVAQ